MGRVRAAVWGLVWLTVVWVALWGQVTVGNVVAGLLLAVAVLALLRNYHVGTTPHVRPLAALRYAVVFTIMLMQSNWSVARTVLSRRITITPTVFTVHLPQGSRFVTTLVANSVTLTPGTLTLEAQEGPDGTHRLFIHALDAPDIDAVRADVLRLHRLAAAAFPQEVTA